MRDCDAILKRHGASIDKFIGDCVFAYWHGTEIGIRKQALLAAEALRSIELDADLADPRPAEIPPRHRHGLPHRRSMSAPWRWARWARVSTPRSATP